MIYFMRHLKTGYIKIGSSDNVSQRMRVIVNAHGVLEPLGLMEGSKDTERQLHAAFRADRAPMKSEVEWYHPNADLLFYIACNADVPISADVDHAARTPTRPTHRGSAICRPFVLRIIDAEKAGRIPQLDRDIANVMGISLLTFKRIYCARYHLLSDDDVQPVADFFGCTIDELLYMEYTPDGSVKEPA